MGYILGVFEALRYYDEGEGEGGGGGGVERGERMWMEAKKELRMEEVFKEEYFDGDGVWKFDVEEGGGGGGGGGGERQYPGGGGTLAGEKEEEEEEGGGDSTTFFDIADIHPLIREWMQKAKDEMKRCGVEDWRSIDVESQPVPAQGRAGEGGGA